MRILVTGGNGCVGKSLADYAKSINSEHEWIYISSKDCNLENLTDTLALFDKVKPDSIIHLAAYVHGMYHNLNNTVSQFTSNVRINENVLEACNTTGVQRGIFCLSVGMFPNEPSKFPIDESQIFEGQPHTSIEGYSYSKRMLYMQCNHYNQQFKREYICIIPPNPCTAVALDREGQRMFWLVVDGRQPRYSEGMTHVELANLCREIGGWTAVALDGGGSSTLAARDEAGKPEVMNCPIHGKHPPGVERPVANHLGVRLK